MRGLQDTMTTTMSIPKCIASVRFRSPEKFCIKTLRHKMFIVARILLPRYGQRRGDVAVELLLFFEYICRSACPNLICFYMRLHLHFDFPLLALYLQF